MVGMRSLFVLLAAMVALVCFGTSAGIADGPAGSLEQIVIEALPPTNEVSGHASATLTARLYDSAGEPVSGMPVTFYVLNTVFGERLMRVGEVVTDKTGIASLVYKPTWVGDHTVVVRFPGDEDFAPTQTSFHIIAAGPVAIHEDAPFGLETFRSWVPLGVGLVVLAIWGTLGLVMLRTVTGLPAAAKAAGLAPLPATFSEPLRPASLKRPLLLVAALSALLVAVPGAWLLSRQDSGGVLLSTESARFGDHQPIGESPDLERATESAFPVTLIRSVPTTITDSNGQLTHDSADLPADVALIGNHVFVLDTNNGRILAVADDGRLISVLVSDPSGGISLSGARAMTAHDGKLYVANAGAGNILVVEPSGRIEDVIVPQVPEGQGPLRPAGIAVTPQGEIWLSDSENHRVLLLDKAGEFLGVIGQGLQSSGEYGFDTPGGLALDPQGNVRVADTLNHEVKTYSPKGVFLSAAGGGRLSEPQGVAVDGRGNSFVSDERLASVLVFKPDGTYVGTIGGESAADGSPADWLQSPYGLKIDRDRLYVMDRLSGLLVFGLEESSPP